ncbi:hypothetical protein T439DRAFT_384532 [Meredithblackwellia eburnea MCA 4105]
MSSSSRPTSSEGPTTTSTAAAATAADPRLAKLFSNVRFWINDSIPPAIRTKLAKFLTQRGAFPLATIDDDDDEHDHHHLGDGEEEQQQQRPRFDIHSVTHVITDTLDLPEYNALVEQQGRIELVTPLWVTRSFDLGTIQQPQFFSPDRAKFFSGYCFCSSELPESDTRALEAGVKSLGGQWRQDLTREVTHLFVVAPSGAKYDMAMQYGPSLGMVVILPAWFEECIKLRQLVPIDTYQFPSPPILNLREWDEPHKSFEERLAEYFKAKSLEMPPPPPAARLTTTSATSLYLGSIHNSLTHQNPRGSLRSSVELYQKTAVVLREASGSGSGGGTGTGTGTVFPAQTELPSCVDPIFGGRTVYLASDLELREGLERAIRQRINEAGGKCWAWGVDGEEESEVASGSGGSGRGSLGARGDQWDRRRRAERALGRAGIVVTKERKGWEFWTAYSKNKTLGNLSWLYHVLASSKLDSPLDHLLHYPLPSGHVPGFEDLTITISNYSGPARDYVRTMIETLGASFAGAMSKKTGFVVTASEYGQKVKHARQWNVPIVSHLWLETCISEWDFVPPISSAAFLPGMSPGTNFMTVLGGTELKKGAIEKWANRPDVREMREEALRSLVEVEEDLGVEEDAMEVEMAQQGDKEEDEQGMDIDDEREEEEDIPAPVLSSKAKGKAREIVTEEQPRSKGSPKVNGTGTPKEKDAKGKGKAKPPPPPSESSSESEEENEAPPPPPPPKASTSKSVKKEAKEKPALKRVPSDTDDEEQEEPRTPVGTKKPKKRKTVLNPNSGSEMDEDLEPKFVAKRPLASSTNNANSTTNGRRPSSSTFSSPLSEPPKSDQSSSEEEEYTPKHPIDFENKIPVVGKRAAASLASKRLAEQMPDVIKFAQEVRNSSTKKRKRLSTSHRARTEEEEDEDEDEEDEHFRKKAAKAAPVVTTDDSDNKSSKKKAVAGTKKTVSKSVVGKSGAAGAKGDTQEVSSFDNPPHAPPPKKYVARAGPKKVRILVTGLGLASDSEHMIQWVTQMAKLGAKFTEEPKEVTHLVVKGISRTEKFLCSLANAPFIVTKEWINSSIKSGELLDEQPFLLKDVAKEREIGDTLARILQRAKARPLFKGITIYLTPSILPNVLTIRRVIECGGGTVSTASFGRQEEDSSSFVVSCPKDRNKWEKYASKGNPVFSVEAVFQSVVHQEIRFQHENRIDLQIERK